MGFADRPESDERSCRQRFGNTGLQPFRGPLSSHVNPGGSGSASVTVNPYGGFNNLVGLTISGMPNGVVANFSPSNTVSNSTMTLTVPASIAAGSYLGTITASAGVLKQTIAMTLVVAAPVTPDFTISASPSIMSVTRGRKHPVGRSRSRPLVHSAVRSSLSEIGAPSGVTASFSPPSTASSSTLDAVRRQ